MMVTEIRGKKKEKKINAYIKTNKKWHKNETRNNTKKNKKTLKVDSTEQLVKTKVWCLDVNKEKSTLEYRNKTTMDFKKTL